VDRETFDRLVSLGVILSSAFPFYTFPLAEERLGVQGEQQSAAALIGWHDRGQHAQPDPRCPRCVGMQPHAVALQAHAVASRNGADARLQPEPSFRNLPSGASLPARDRPKSKTRHSLTEDDPDLARVVAALPTQHRPKTTTTERELLTLIDAHGRESVVGSIPGANALPSHINFVNRLRMVLEEGTPDD
jgi:hypothetical protein